MKQPYLSVIIPAYNEAKRLPATLLDIDRHLGEVDFEYEIIVVDNNSSDATREIAERFSSCVPELSVIECKTQGKGAAVQKGMLEAKGKIRLFMDADNSTSLEHFFKMQHYFNEGYDVVIGSRSIEGAKKVPPQPWYKTLLGNGGIQLTKALVLSEVHDTQCGFKAFTQDAAVSIFPHLTIRGWLFDVEALMLAKKIGYTIREVPVTWVNSFDSRVSLMGYARSLRDIFSIKWGMLTGTYASVGK